MKAVTGFGVACLLASLLLRGDSGVASRPSCSSRGAGPPTIVWAWEEPEDLRALDPARTGVAFLAERVSLGNVVQVVPRRQPILVPGSVYAVAVARIEVGSGFRDSPALRQQTAAALLRAAALPGIRAVQVDFDATASQRDFYADVLRRIRADLPPQLGLTMTALVSWCAESDGWLDGLPVDAAVPMYFRLGRHLGRWRVREPLCVGNVGVSTDEPGSAPRLGPADRAYVFSPRPWTPDQLARLNRSGFPQAPVQDLVPRGTR
jgi:hypothetical protein